MKYTYKNTEILSLYYQILDRVQFLCGLTINTVHNRLVDYI